MPELLGQRHAQVGLPDTEVPGLPTDQNPRGELRPAPRVGRSAGDERMLPFPGDLTEFVLREVARTGWALPGRHGRAA